MDGQTCVKTLPSRRTTYAVGNHFLSERYFGIRHLHDFVFEPLTFEVFLLRLDLTERIRSA